MKRLTEPELAQIWNDLAIDNQLPEATVVQRLIAQVYSYKNALKQISELPGPYYSRTLQKAVEIARKEIG